MSRDSLRREGLEDLRREIDRIDSGLIALLAERMGVVERVIAVKTRDNLPAIIPERIEDVVAHVRTEAAAQGLEPELAETVWRNLIDWVCRYEARHLG
ncbi:chorismate mutase [Labrys wisconsinensis]|uniref:chorismate mutase n=1 Tax=Labrys wisconsinensis TaxID=425677 RepID=A0ABU0J679_9HYPH|nr:chorismate mutase [Labrys wisconsinensis]MDQ0468707.1 isochorismate pyruvate lyase [Labrys wisconsinensis]